MKEQLFWLYRNLTKSNRAALLDKLREQSQVPVGVLFYHRIADSHPNGWTMGFDDFRRQLDWLQQEFEIVSLAEAQNRIRRGTGTPTVSITFDDGYGDNSDFAIPELVRRGLTATYFVSTDFIESGRSFPHDLDAGQPLRPNTREELQAYLEMGIEIGAHTQSHCDCGQLQSMANIRREITQSAEQLASWLNCKIDYFAFPYGQPYSTSQLAVDCILEYGFKGFCTAYGAWNWPTTKGVAREEAFHIRRIHADPGIERLKNWLTLDRRKLVERVELPFEILPQEPVASFDQSDPKPSPRNKELQHA